jgi:hypothetical protein
MTANTNPDVSAKMPSDVFDMERLAKSEPTFKGTGGPQNDAGPAETKPSKSMRVAKPIHFGLAGVALAMAWIGWPYVSPVEGSPPQPATRLLMPATAEHLPVRAAPAPATDTAAPTQPIADYGHTAPTGPMGVPPFAQPMPTALAAPTAPPSRLPHRKRSTAQRSRPVSLPLGPASSKFSLNTVYAGQAWIQDDERTYVVQAGDTIKGIAIISIDARERLVVTSQGAIR